MSRAAELLAQVRELDARLAEQGRDAAEKLWDEDHHQIILISWARNHLGDLPELRLLHHSPNGGKRQTVTRRGRTYSPEGAKFKRMGTRAGYPDLLLDVPLHGYHGLRIELKDLKGNTPSPEQRGWIVAHRQKGYAADVARGWRQGRIQLLAYLAGEVHEWYWVPKKGTACELPGVGAG